MKLITIIINNEDDINNEYNNDTVASEAYFIKDIPYSTDTKT